MDRAFPHPEIRLHSGRKPGMKIKGLIFTALLGGMTLLLRGQDAAPPAVDLYGTEEKPEITATPFREPNGPELPELSQPQVRPSPGAPPPAPKPTPAGKHKKKKHLK